MPGLALHNSTCGLGSVSRLRTHNFSPALPSRKVSVDRRSPVTHASAIAPPAKITVKNFDGAESGSEDLMLKVAGDKTAKGLVHRYLVTVRQNARAGTASTKTRAEVRGGGKKPYKQKGRGGARRGSETSPLLVGGGVVFGPKPKDWSISMNRKERKLALATALQSAAGNTTIVEDLKGKITAPKTKVFVEALTRLGVDQEEHSLLILNEQSPNIELSARNVEKVKVNFVDKLNVYDVLRADKILVESSAFKYIQDFFGGKESESAPEKTKAPSAKAAAPA